MNFLAHLWLTERRRLPLAGAVLGDWLRGPLPATLPAPLARSVRLHRRIDAVTDRLPLVRSARERFAPGARRYAGIILDVLFDHALAQDWARYGGAEPLADFARRAADEVAAAASWFESAGGPVPHRDGFAVLLLSYQTPDGIERALRRTAQRLRDPSGLLAALDGWREHVPAVAAALPALLSALQQVEPEPN